MDWLECTVVESVPRRMGGQPVLRHTRMRADWVFENYLLGMTCDEQVEQYDLDLADVKETIDYAVGKYIETREREDSIRSEYAMGSTQAA